MAARLNGSTLDKLGFGIWDCVCEALCEIVSSSDENDGGSVNSIGFERLSRTVAVVRAIHQYMRVFFQSQRRLYASASSAADVGGIAHSRRRSYGHAQLDALLSLFSSSSSSSSSLSSVDMQTGGSAVL